MNGFIHKLTYHMRAIPNIDQHLSTMDGIVDNKFIPAITEGHICSKDERLFLSLPVKKGGLGIPILSNVAPFEFTNSRMATEHLVLKIKNQDSTSPVDGEHDRNSRRNVIKAREERNNIILQQLCEEMKPEELRANDLSRMKGASCWLTMLPLKSENFLLNKREFYDALSLRNRWTPKFLPSFCPCGKRYDVDHAMSCMKGGFIYRRHDDVRDMLASLLKDVCHDVHVEPHIETLTGDVLPDGTNSSDETRLDVSVRDFW